MISHTLHTTIDTLPIYNWHQIHVTGDLKNLIRVKRFRMPKNAMKVWTAMYADFYIRYGKTPEFIDYLEKIVDLTVMIASNALQFDSATEIHIKLAEAELEKFATTAQTNDFFVNNAALAKAYTMPINPKNTSVAEYFGIIQYLKDEASKQKPSP